MIPIVLNGQAEASLEDTPSGTSGQAAELDE